MSDLAINGSGLSTPLMQMLDSDAIMPGVQPSYQLCKTIYTYHPLGKKLVDAPIRVAQSQPRNLTVANVPGTEVEEQFEKVWGDMGVNKIIANVMALSRIYGIASVGIVTRDPLDRLKPLDLRTLAAGDFVFNVWDPLNTAGSLVLNQDPNAFDFQKAQTIGVSGEQYHASRTCSILNESAVYIEFTDSAFGFVGRSVFQRVLFPLKSYVQSMRTNDLVQRKAGLLVAMMKQVGSITDKVMGAVAGVKRNLLKEAETGNVLSVGQDDKIESLNMNNTDTAMKQSRMNILEDIAAGADMPAQMLNSETFAEGFGEGTEDAKTVVRFINRIREEMQPLYDFFDMIVMYKAWTPEFFATMQTKYPETFKGMAFDTALISWVNGFKAEWPNLMIEPDSEKAKNEDVKLKSLIAVVEVLLDTLDPMNKATLIQWAADNINESHILFPNALTLDAESLQDFFEQQAEQAQALNDAAMNPDDSEEGSIPPAKAPAPFAQAA